MLPFPHPLRLQIELPFSSEAAEIIKQQNNQTRKAIRPLLLLFQFINLIINTFKTVALCLENTKTQMQAKGRTYRSKNTKS